ncbi:hypothetical protein Zmor_022070 [Zophobas morio]|uniref:Uncharacterized protein n=1 Tax=Zophobas morio TaxID=2755281 RepID=A0AA38M0N0_9CUCU|nr:hypothetical protein Zmor_022070 [Zophobas morio]
MKHSITFEKFKVPSSLKELLEDKFFFKSVKDSLKEESITEEDSQMSNVMLVTNNKDVNELKLHEDNWQLNCLRQSFFPYNNLLPLYRYELLLAEASKIDFEVSLKLFKSLKFLGHRPTFKTYSIITEICVINNKYAQALEFFNIAREIFNTSYYFEYCPKYSAKLYFYGIYSFLKVYNNKRLAYYYLNELNHFPSFQRDIKLQIHQPHFVNKKNWGKLKLFNDSVKLNESSTQKKANNISYWFKFPYSKSFVEDSSGFKVEEAKKFRKTKEVNFYKEKIYLLFFKIELENPANFVALASEFQRRELIPNAELFYLKHEFSKKWKDYALLKENIQKWLKVTNCLKDENSSSALRNSFYEKPAFYNMQKCAEECLLVFANKGDFSAVLDVRKKIIYFNEQVEQEAMKLSFGEKTWLFLLLISSQSSKTNNHASILFVELLSEMILWDIPITLRWRDLKDYSATFNLDLNPQLELYLETLKKLKELDASSLTDFYNKVKIEVLK